MFLQVLLIQAFLQVLLIRVFFEIFLITGLFQKLKTGSGWIAVSLKKWFLLQLVWICHRNFPLRSPFTDNAQTEKKKQKKKQCTNHYLGFQSFHLHHLLQKKWEVSSAKSLIWVNRLLQVPFIYTKKNPCPRIDPWGTIAFTVLHSEFWTCKNVLWNWTSKSLRCNFRRLPEISNFLSLQMKPSRHTLSKPSDPGKRIPIEKRWIWTCIDYYPNYTNEMTNQVR